MWVGEGLCVDDGENAVDVDLGGNKNMGPDGVNVGTAGWLIQPANNNKLAKRKKNFLIIFSQINICKNL